MRADRSVAALADVYQDRSNLERVRGLSRRRQVSGSSMRRGVTVVVLNLDRPDLILPMARSAEPIGTKLAEQGLGFELLIGDTGSRDGAVLAMLEAPPARVTVVTGLDYHFSRSNNDVYDGRASFDHLLLLNNDVLVRDAGPILAMVQHLEAHPEAGIVGLVLDFPNGTLQHGGVDIVRSGRLVGIPVHHHARDRWPHQPGASWRAIGTTGAALMIRADLWERLSGLDEDYQKECQDVDLCLRALRLGYGTRVVDAGPVVHEENGTRPKGESSLPDRRLFLRRWTTFLAAMDV